MINNKITKTIDNKLSDLENSIDRISDLLTYENVKPIIDDISKKYNIKLKIVGGIKRKGYSEHDIDVETDTEISKDIALSIMFDIQKITNSGVDVFVPLDNSILRYGTTQSIGGWTIHRMSKERRKVVDEYAIKIDELKSKLKDSGRLGKELEKLQMERYKTMESTGSPMETLEDYYLPDERI